MSMASDPAALAGCTQLGPFIDGELDDAAAAAFRLHLGVCPHCPRGLENAIVLDVLAEDLAAAPEIAGRTVEVDAVAPAAVARARARSPGEPGAWVRRLWAKLDRHRLLWAPALVGVAAAAGIALWQRANDEWLTGARVEVAVAPACRTTIGRLAYPGYSHPRPCAVMRDGAVRPPPPREATLAAFEAAGNQHGLAVVHLADGDLVRAARHLAAAPASPAVLNDQAVLALEKHDAQAALGLAEAALAGAPTLAPALWNRAEALARLGRNREAAVAFARIAGSGEAGWAAEARRRVRELGTAGAGP